MLRQSATGGESHNRDSFYRRGNMGNKLSDKRGLRIHSLKIKLTLIMAALVTAVVALICVFNSAFFESYYVNERVDLLESSYKEVKDVYFDEDYTRDRVVEKILQISNLHNINTYFIDSQWNVIYSSHNNMKEALRRIQEMIFKEEHNEFFADKVIIEETEEFTIIKSNDKNREFSYIEIYGVLEDGSQILMQITLDSIQENVKIFNKFVQTVGIVMILLSIIIVYFIAAGFTKPVKELSTVAEKMSHMDFSVKYSGEDNSEIGLLGQSINILSDKLEQNISELKAANIELQKDIEIKNRNEEMRREFVSNVSHELKTPLALVQGYAEGLKEGVMDDPESMEYYCDVIIDETNKMNNMVKKLLTLNQIEYGNDPVNIERIQINEFISAILKAYSLKLDKNGIKLEFESDGEFYVWFDLMQLEEVFINMLSNAINHCENEKNINVNIKKVDKYVKISVFNTGKNIPESDLKRIWEKFYKVDKARTREYGGNGIGLSIVKAILDNFEAPFGVENKENGVEFWFMLEV